MFFIIQWDNALCASVLGVFRYTKWHRIYKSYATIGRYGYYIHLSYAILR